MVTKDIKETSLKAFVLAGGLGTRLRSLISDRPKPMAEAQNRPFLEYLIEQLRGQGFDQIVLCVGYRADQIENYFGDGHRWGVSLSYSVESEPLGTAGAILNAQPWIDGPFLLMNGDSYIDADFRALAAAHTSRRAADPRTIGTILARHVDDAAAYGTLEIDAQGRISSFREKAGAESGWINSGVYVLEPCFLGLIPPHRAVSIERETFPLALAQGRHLISHPARGFFVDIGTPQGYGRFQAYVAQRQPTPPSSTRSGQ